MKKTLYPLFVALLIAILIISPAAAGSRVIVGFSLSSLVADITGLGFPSNTDYTFTLTASGIASVLCTNNGGNQARGQNSPHVDGSATDDIKRNEIDKGGKIITSLEAVPELEKQPNVYWDVGGCPNSNWTAIVDFIYWQTATLVITTSTGESTTYLYRCDTTRTGPAGDPNSTFDDGTVTCERIN